MAKNKRKKSKKGKGSVQDEGNSSTTDQEVGVEEMVEVDDQEEAKSSSRKVTLEMIEAMSDEDNDSNLEDEQSEWAAEAKALRQAISEGAFDNIVDSSNGNSKEEKRLQNVEKINNEEEISDNDDSSEDDEAAKKMANSKRALTSVTSEISRAQASLPWAERFDITSTTPLAFGKPNSPEDLETIDVHDDLKRELQFYNMALESVHQGRNECEKHKIAFSRPDDFFAEMVKTDDHMAKVKDRLIFETKKMEAFEQRKSNKEQKLRAKESHAHRLVEKAKAKRKHMQNVDEWAKNAALNRLGDGRVNDDDDQYLDHMSGRGKSKKRHAMDRKYGHGGKKGRFKQNDKKSMNDMSGFNPKGQASMAKRSGGTKRKGKRARDAMKARA